MKGEGARGKGMHSDSQKIMGKNEILRIWLAMGTIAILRVY